MSDPGPTVQEILSREHKWTQLCSTCFRPIAEPQVVCANCNGGTAVLQGVLPGTRHLRIVPPQGKEKETR